MNRIPLGKRGWMILAAVLAVGLIGSAGLAIANPYGSVSNEETCAVWDTPGTPRYQQCLDNLNVDGQSGLVPGSQPGTSITPTTSATSSDGNSNPPNYFCLDASKSHYASTKRIKGCENELVCLWQPSDRKYHCVDGSGKSVDPPGGICQLGRNPHYACADDQVVSVIRPEIGEPTSSPPDTRSTIPPTLSSHPALADPTIQPTQELTVTSPSPIPTPTPTATPTPTSTIDPSDPVVQVLEQARTQGLRIWLETDLVKAWKRGPEQLKAAAEKLKLYANQRGVVGVKFAYDLGLRGFDDEAQTVDPTRRVEFLTSRILQFVTEASQALRAALPPGRQIAVDVVIPELGCGSNQLCALAMQRDYPLLTLANVERYVLTGAVDAVNIAGSQYAASKIQPETAAVTNFWQRFRLLSWKTRMPGLYIGSREIGLAHAGPDRQIAEADADRLVKERVDEPLRTGADQVILWTWKQTFDPDGDGPAERQTWRLADQGARSNSILTALGKARRPLRLAVTYNPREQETNIASDVKAIADIASAIYIFVP